MKDVYENALSSLVNGVIYTTTLKINKAKFNKGVTGRIANILSNNTYIVTINGKEYTAKSKFSFQVNDVVKIICWNNDMNEMYIIY